MKHHPWNSKSNARGPKLSQPSTSPHIHKVTKSKGKKTDRHCKFCDQDGHRESRFNNMEALEAMMKKKNIHLETSSTSSSRHALFSSSYALSSSSSSCSSSNEWLICFGSSSHMAKNKSIFWALYECNTKHIFVCDDKSLSVEGSRTVHLDNGFFNDVFSVLNISCNLILVYQIIHLGEGKNIEF